ncbi:MAG: D-alanyl-D-alanine carboxypeptidase, partial [Oscillospiraceae bacterium]|nr:D-alanyl-D-alanine carboxypeptidase [Oscillospiraceae bacterium]
MKRIVALTLFLVFLHAPFLALAQEGGSAGGSARIPSSASDFDFSAELQLYAAASYLVNLDTGRVIYQHNASVRVAPASTTKIMTSALALELCDDPSNTVVTLPDDLWVEFSGMDISHAGLSGA